VRVGVDQLEDRGVVALFGSVVFEVGVEVERERQER
jgi:hypothetical protein